MSSRLPRRGPLLLVFALNEQVGTLLGRTFVSAPLRADEYAVYSVLYNVGETTPSELAADLGMGRSTLSSWLRRMEDRRHLDRRSNPADGRSALISLTVSGREVTEQSYPAFDRAIETFRRHLGGDEAQLLQSMELLSVALAAAVDELAGEVEQRA